MNKQNLKELASHITEFAEWKAEKKYKTHDNSIWKASKRKHQEHLKLNKQIRLEIYQKWLKGEAIGEIATEYKESRELITRIRNWHLPELADFIGHEENRIARMIARNLDKKRIL